MLSVQNLKKNSWTFDIYICMFHETFEPFLMIGTEVGILNRLWRVVTFDLSIADLFALKSGTLFITVNVLSLMSNDKSVWTHFDESSIDNARPMICIRSLILDSAILSLSQSSVVSASSSSLVLPSLIVNDPRGWRKEDFSSCCSWWRINETLSVKSASMGSTAEREKVLEMFLPSFSTETYVHRSPSAELEGWVYWSVVVALWVSWYPTIMENQLTFIRTEVTNMIVSHDWINNRANYSDWLCYRYWTRYNIR